jgi:hypothetical protein
MSSSRMLGLTSLVRTHVSEERIASIVRVTRIGELRTLAVTNNPHNGGDTTLRNVGSFKSNTM